MRNYCKKNEEKGCYNSRKIRKFKMNKTGGREKIEMMKWKWMYGKKNIQIKKSMKENSYKN